MITEKKESLKPDYRAGARSTSILWIVREQRASNCANPRAGALVEPTTTSIHKLVQCKICLSVNEVGG